MIFLLLYNILLNKINIKWRNW